MARFFSWELRYIIQSFPSRFNEFRERTFLFKFIVHPHEFGVKENDLSFIPGVSYRDFELELAEMQVSYMWTKKFKLLNDDFEELARQQAELAMRHIWSELKKLQYEDQIISSIYNAIPVTFHTLQSVATPVLTMFRSTYSCEQSFSHMNRSKQTSHDG